MMDHLFWDAGEPAREGFRGGLWAARKLLVALVGAALLTWWEWEERHPQDIAVTALIHFVFVLSVLAMLVPIGRWLRRGPGAVHQKSKK